MNSWRAAAGVGLLLIASGCRSNLGTVYGVASGRTEIEDVLPERTGAVTPIKQASFAPPGSDPQSPAMRRPLKPGETPLPEPTRQAATNAVLDDLESLGAENPAAQLELIRRLKAAQPGHWELVARNFRSELRQHHRLTRGAMPAAHTTTAPGEPVQPAFAPPPVETPADSMQQPRRLPPPDNGAADRRGDYAGGIRLASANMPVITTGPAPGGGHQAQPAAGGPARPMVINNPYGNEAVGPTTMPTTTQATKPVAGQLNSTVSFAGASGGATCDANGCAACGSATAEAALESAIDRLAAQAAADPLSTGEAYDHARLRLLQLASGDLDGAVTPIPSLSPTEQSYWSKQLFAISTMLNYESQPELARRAAAAGLHLDGAQQELQQLSTLAVRNLTFCTKVEGFGAYTERPTRRFRPGEKVQLYVEVANFRSRPSGDWYETRIGGSYRVLDGNGNQVQGREITPIDDACLSRRNDFHVHVPLPLPERVYPGEYQFELTLHDQLGNKMGRASIDFEIIEDPPRR